MEIETKYTVSELTRHIKSTLENSFTSIWVQGEISNFTRHSSGHFYLSLKDEKAQISAVMWRGKNLSLYFTPQDGMKVLAKGRISVFEKRGVYQLDIDALQPLGVGDLQLAFEQLKARLLKEGLFSDEHKKEIPEFADTIGIVTSPTGAAIRDLVSVAKRRYPGINLVLRPAKVQGDGAAEEIAEAIEEFNEFGGVDLLIVGRGGGSLEDLWAFNEEIVARAIFNSDLPVISAVGHEVDFTIADFVADFRAPTPSAAAEIAVMNSEDLLSGLLNRTRQMARSVNDMLSSYRDRISSLEKSHAFKAPVDLIKQYAMQVDYLVTRLDSERINRFRNLNDTVIQLEKRLQSLNPENVLKRGYSITYNAKTDNIISSSKDIAEGEDVYLKFGEGSAGGTIHTVNHTEQENG